MLMTHGGPTATKRPSLFVGELTFPGDGSTELEVVDRTTTRRPRPRRRRRTTAATATTAIDAAAALVRRVMPLPTARERRLALRLRASELVGLIEATDADGWPEGETARAGGSPAELAGRRPRGGDGRRRGAGRRARPADLPVGRRRHRRRGEPAPGRAAAAALQLLVVRTYDACGLQYAFQYVYRIPEPPDPAPR